MKDVFVNGEIFLSEGDYIIGGFHTDQKNDFNFADFKVALDDRISNLIDDYLERAASFNLSLGLKNPKEVANHDLALIVYDNLGVRPDYFDKTSVTQAIYSSHQMMRWVDDLKENIRDYPKTYFGEMGGITNKQNQVGSNELKVIKECVEDTTFEQFIEQLSLIES